MTTSPRFWNKIAAKYAAKPIEDVEAYRHKLSVTQSYLRPDMRMLEFGCGTGGTALLHAPHVHSVRAIDFSENMIRIARDNAAEDGAKNVTFETAAIEDISEPDASYDVILGMSILHLLEDPDAAMTRVARLLKPGGLFVSSTVCIGDMPVWVRWMLPIGHALRLLPLVQRFTETGLLTRLKNAGFQLDQTWRPGPGKAVFVVARAPG